MEKKHMEGMMFISWMAVISKFLEINLEEKNQQHISIIGCQNEVD